MTRTPIGLAALLTLTLAAAAGTGSPDARRGPADYHKTHGVKFAHGYYYKGKDHRHWSKSYYCPKWKCTFLYCPYAKAWYYYYAPKKVYYPASYLSKASPTPGGPAPSGGAPTPAATPDAPPARPGPAPAPPTGAAPTFAKDVLPVLQRSCAGCHSPGKKRGGLDLTTLAAATRGGDGGPAVRPGKPDDSPLYTAVATGRMPPGGGKKLSAAETKLLRDWIVAGARER